MYEKVKAGGAAVLSCPAYFTEAQREAMAVAGEDAGIVVLDTIEEPVVSCQQHQLSYGTYLPIIYAIMFRIMIRCCNAVRIDEHSIYVYFFISRMEYFLA